MVTLNPFRPIPALRNPHIQTIVGAFLRSQKGVDFNRVRINTPDDDFIALDFPDIENGPRWREFDETSPIVLLLHGMGGSARQGYACEAYRQLAQVGIRSVGMNYRSCGGEINQKPRTYHAGATEDVETVVSWLHEQHPYAPLGILGVSFGSSLLLKFLGEVKRDIVAGVAISAPFDLEACTKVLSKGLARLYGQNVLSGLKPNIQQKAHQLGHLIDVDKVMTTKTLYEFDTVCTAPLHGFPDVTTYYAQCSAKQFIATITTPTLIIRSLDDPFFANDIPYEPLEQNKCIQTELTNYGGHVGFVESGPSWTWWAHQQATQFFKEHLIIC